MDIAATLDLSLEILCEDLPELYRRADDSIRRLINQAISNALFVCDETITDAELAEPFAARPTRPARQRRTPGPAPPALPGQGERSRPLPEPGAFPCWFD
ncbi:MAG TPA: hypothetical protein VN892_06885 [Solirubrobacteraceae bacterium]|nr:hypothetical protein [Solirubrobacteraceae bacterium]